MPTYEYECTCCSSRFELKQSFSDAPLVSCTRCGGDVRRIFSPVPVIFKGSGFYITDSRDNHGHSSSEDSTGKTKTTGTDEVKTAGTDETKASSTDETKASSTAETKTASTTEAKAGSTEEK